MVVDPVVKRDPPGGPGNPCPVLHMELQTEQGFRASNPYCQINPVTESIMEAQTTHASDIWRASAARMRWLSIACLLTLMPIAAALQILA